MWVKIKKILKYTFLALVISTIIFIVFNYESAVYGFRQAKGQFKIIWNTKPIETVLADKTFPDSLKKRIEYIQEIKRFAVDSLGLEPSDNYTTFFDQKSKPILWVLTACPPFELKAKTWTFPIVGKFSYKGHFEKEIADHEIELLKKEGLDTRLGEVSAWSTLGYLKDPILSSMLNRSDGGLAALIIHELTHGTLFVKNNLEFNENLADFVGDYGAVRFLEYKFGKDSPQLKKYEFSKKYNDAYSQHLLKGAKKLDSLYKTKGVEKKAKDGLILKIMSSTDTLLAGDFRKQLLGKKKWKWDETNIPNNAYFVGFLTYQSKQNEFEEEFRTKFHQNFKQYLSFLKKKYPNFGI